MKKRKPMSEESKARIREGAQRRWAEYRRMKESKVTIPYDLFKQAQNLAVGKKEEPVAYMLKAPGGDQFLVTKIGEHFRNFLKDNGFEIWAVSLSQKL